MDEKVDILDSFGEPTGEVVWKSSAHRRGLFHRCFHCWISTPADGSGGPYLLVQRRAAAKETWPGKLDVTAAGHLASGETTLDGLREVEEELGLRVTPEDLVPLGTRRVEQNIPGGCDREFHDVCLMVSHLHPKDLRLQKEEVAAVLWLELESVEKLYAGESIPAKEWEYGESEPATRPIRLENFVPNDDRYLLQAARAVRKALSGKPVADTFKPEIPDPSG